MFQARVDLFVIENVVEIAAREGDTAKGEYGTKPAVEMNCPLLDSWPLLNVNKAAAEQFAVVLPSALIYDEATSLGMMEIGPGETRRRYCTDWKPLYCNFCQLETKLSTKTMYIRPSWESRACRRIDLDDRTVRPCR